MLISPAYAQTAAGGGGFDLMAFLPLILIFVVFYFLLIRPQQKKMKQHREMVGALKRGDRVVFAGGLIGTIAKVTSDTELVIEVAEGVRVKAQRMTVAEVLAKTEPRGDDAEDSRAESKA
ncbi:MAG: preprotein translocase subunit YajC [Alphaproteobacteria bacterium]|nr:MAG: preprotein translocase subunit YajC [Alphaproteobacteria bacterium]